MLTAGIALLIIRFFGKHEPIQSLWEEFPPLLRSCPDGSYPPDYSGCSRRMRANESCKAKVALDLGNCFRGWKLPCQPLVREGTIK
jgi:hypothetical protein